MVQAADSKVAAPAKGVMLPMMLIVAIGLAGGAGFSIFISGKPAAMTGVQSNHDDPGRSQTDEAKGANVKAASRGDDKNTTHAGTELALPLDPIIVNLAGPSGKSLRMEGWVSFEATSKNDRSLLLKEISQDILGFLRTTPIAQLESPVGLEFLREDMSDLARIRSRGSARRVILKTLVIE